MAHDAIVGLTLKKWLPRLLAPQGAAGGAATSDAGPP